MRITDYRDIRAVVAGGGNMTQPDTNHPKSLVGYLNAQAALSMLEEHKIIVAHQDTGGMEGRKMSIQCSTGEFEVISIPRIAA
jgi:chemotaxis protein CheD